MFQWRGAGADVPEVDNLVAGGRHFSGTVTRLLVEQVRDRVGDGAVDELLRRAGEARPVAELLDDTRWSTYDELRRLLEAAAPLLADVGGLGGVADTERIVGGTTPELAATMQSFGSPMAMSMAVGSAGLFPIISLEPEVLGPARMRWHRRMLPGFEPFPELCQFLDGMVPLGIRLFGMRAIDVVDTSCQCRGDDECTTIVEWDEREDLESQLELLRIRLDVSESRLSSFQEVVGEIVSTGDLDSVLTRIVQYAARAVQAPGFVLVVDAAPHERRIYTEGIGEADAEIVLAGDSGALSVEVTSAQRHYGRLVAVSPSESIAFSAASLESYARLAATALDAAFSIEEARRQERTTAALLDLSTSLAELSGMSELATKLTGALRAVIDCDCAGVLIVTDGVARLAAHDGFPARHHAMLDQLELAVAPDAVDHTMLYTTAETSEAVRPIMEATGLQALAVAPIPDDDGAAGLLLAAVRHNPHRLSADPALASRFAGLAGQSAVALRNSRLVDQMRHQSLHDALTGLPNRVLILDRAQHVLARAQRDGTEVAALFVDLDGFKEVNDTLGHHVGDVLLAMVAHRLTTAVRASDTVGRLGGDEFVVLVEGASLDAGAGAVADRLLDVLREPFHLPGSDRALTVGASIGIAVGLRPSPDELLRDADAALYRAKAAGKGCHQTFTPDMRADDKARTTAPCPS